MKGNNSQQKHNSGSYKSSTSAYHSSREHGERNYNKYSRRDDDRDRQPYNNDHSRDGGYGRAASSYSRHRGDEGRNPSYPSYREYEERSSKDTRKNDGLRYETESGHRSYGHRDHTKARSSKYSIQELKDMVKRINMLKRAQRSDHINQLIDEITPEMIAQFNEIGLSSFINFCAKLSSDIRNQGKLKSLIIEWIEIARNKLGTFDSQNLVFFKIIDLMRININIKNYSNEISFYGSFNQ